MSIICTKFFNSFKVYHKKNVYISRENQLYHTIKVYVIQITIYKNDLFFSCHIKRMGFLKEKKKKKTVYKDT